MIAHIRGQLWPPHLRDDERASLRTLADELALDLVVLDRRHEVQSGAVDCPIDDVRKHGLQSGECFLVCAESLRPPDMFAILQHHEFPWFVFRSIMLGQSGRLQEEFPILPVSKQLMNRDELKQAGQLPSLL